MILELPLSKLRPNNWYLCQEKVEKIREIWREGRSESLPPVLVTSIDGEWSLIDGHSRAFVALENGLRRLRAEIRPLQEIEGNSNLYALIHREGPKQGVSLMTDLKERILPAEEYHQRWIEYCQSRLQSLS